MTLPTAHLGARRRRRRRPRLRPAVARPLLRRRGRRPRCSRSATAPRTESELAVALGLPRTTCASLVARAYRRDVVDLTARRRRGVLVRRPLRPLGAVRGLEGRARRGPRAHSSSGGSTTTRSRCARPSTKLRDGHPAPGRDADYAYLLLAEAEDAGAQPGARLSLALRLPRRSRAPATSRSTTASASPTTVTSAGRSRRSAPSRSCTRPTPPASRTPTTSASAARAIRTPSATAAPTAASRTWPPSASG